MLMFVDTESGEIIGFAEFSEIIEGKWIGTEFNSLIQIDQYEKVDVDSIPEGSKWYKNGKFYKYHPQVVAEKLKQLTDTDAQLIRLIEDLVAFCEGMGLVVPEAKKNLIAYRNELRSYL